ncbi:MAG: AbiEi antitoxin N-terminal domain-containing protein [Paludibacteraceae bacterium]|nr:AbiEi antitoxin N-terminal domain-containing protein [Paludibacteraceae bacterium]
MATTKQHILETAPRDPILFGSWLSDHGLDARGQHAYMKSGWLNRISKGGYKIHGTEPRLLAAISSYNTQLGNNSKGLPNKFQFCCR